MAQLGLKSRRPTQELTGGSRQLSPTYIMQRLCSRLFMILWSDHENQPHLPALCDRTNLQKTLPHSGSECGLWSPTTQFTTCHWPAVPIGALYPLLATPLPVKGDLHLPHRAVRIKQARVWRSVLNSLAHSEHRLKYFFLLHHHEEGPKSRWWF